MERAIRVHINRTKNEDVANEIATFVGRIFRIYLNEKEGILKVYQSVIPEFTELEEIRYKGTSVVQGFKISNPSFSFRVMGRAYQAHPTIIDHLDFPKKSGLQRSCSACYQSGRQSDHASLRSWPACLTATSTSSGTGVRSSGLPNWAPPNSSAQ